MELDYYFSRRKIKKDKIRIKFDKDPKKSRPSWVETVGLPKMARFIAIKLNDKSGESKRIVYYKTYLISKSNRNIYLPVDYTFDEMKSFYDKFSEMYDNELRGINKNRVICKIVAKKLKKYATKNGEILDVGAGTGLITKIFLKEGFENITLLDYSAGMLNVARKRKELKNCKFLQADIRNFNTGKKYDAIISNFALGSNSYFDKKETEEILKRIKKSMNSSAVISVVGNFSKNIFRKEFEEIDSGKHELDKKRGIYVSYFIGKKTDNKKENNI